MHTAYVTADSFVLSQSSWLKNMDDSECLCSPKLLEALSRSTARSQCQAATFAAYSHPRAVLSLLGCTHVRLCMRNICARSSCNLM